MPPAFVEFRQTRSNDLHAFTIRFGWTRIAAIRLQPAVKYILGGFQDGRWLNHIRAKELCLGSGQHEQRSGQQATLPEKLPCPAGARRAAHITSRADQHTAKDYSRRPSGSTRSARIHLETRSDFSVGSEPVSRAVRRTTADALISSPTPQPASTRTRRCRCHHRLPGASAPA